MVQFQRLQKIGSKCYAISYQGEQLGTFKVKNMLPLLIFLFCLLI